MRADSVLKGDPAVGWSSMRRSGRARRISLRVSSAGWSGNADPAAGTWMPRWRRAFARREGRAGFGTAHRKCAVNRLCRYLIGASVPVEGRSGAGSCRKTGGAASADVTMTIEAPGDGAAMGLPCEAFLKTYGAGKVWRRRQTELCSLPWAVKFGFQRITLRDTRSRWGSCSIARETLMYSWRLILAPPEVLDYVAAHEVAHLAHMDHSPGLLGGGRRALCPGYLRERHGCGFRRDGAGFAQLSVLVAAD